MQFFEVWHIVINFFDGGNCTFKERIFNSKHAPMTNCTAQNSAEDVAAPLVGRQNTVHNHDCHAPRVVGNDFKGNIFLRVVAVLQAATTFNVLNDWEEQIRFKVRHFVLQDGGETFKPATRINIFVLKWLVLAFVSLVVLREDQVPNFQVTIAITAGRAGLLATAALFAQVNVNF